MVFSSVVFLCIFLPAVLLGYYILPRKVRNLFLLVASLFFYAWGGPKHLIWLLASMIVNYCFGLIIAALSAKDDMGRDAGKPPHPLPQKTALTAAIIINISSLLYFKYSGMLAETVNGIFHLSVKVPDIILPLGISFYTFQGMSYLIDVYRTEGMEGVSGAKQEVAERNPVKFALFISMFPQLLQGPIIRYSDVRDTLNEPKITADDFTKGIERFITGLAKKAIIANTIGEVCDGIFEISTQYLSLPVAWLGAVLYTLQIYYDFSGYTDMAIGIGKFFGFGFRENFNYPYISKSVTDFWRRWHITLSNWFRDYLYIPLGGNRTGNVYINLLIVFLATGIWHGAAWSYLVWGLWHGLFMLVERALRRKSLGIGLPKAVSDFLRWGYTMLVVTLGWVLFKLEDFSEAFSYIKVMFGIERNEYSAFSTGFFLDRRLLFFLIIAVVGCIPWVQVLPERLSRRFVGPSGNSGTTGAVRYACLLVLLVISFIFIVNTTYSPFIYFRY